MKPPVFELEGFFRTIFYRNPEYSLKTVDQKGTEGLGERLVEKLGVKLGENEGRVLRLIAQDRFITTEALAKNLKISTTAVGNNIGKLKDCSKGSVPTKVAIGK